MFRFAPLLAVWIAVWLTLGVATAHAQTEEQLTEARALFAEGVQLTEQERWEEAAERFRRVMAVRATSQVKFNLALALEHTGELAEAAALLREVAADSALDRRTRRDANQLLATIAPRLARLTVRLQGDEAGITVTMDGDPVGLDRIGRPMEVDPGTHRLATLRGRRELASESVTLAAGESASIRLSTTAQPSLAVDQELRDPTPLEPVAEHSVLDDWWFWAIVGAAVVVAIGIGVAAGAAASGPTPVEGNLSPGVLQVELP